MWTMYGTQEQPDKKQWCATLDDNALKAWESVRHHQRGGGSGVGDFGIFIPSKDFWVPPSK